MSFIIQTVFANLIDWLFKPLDGLCTSLLTGAFSGLVGSLSNDEWNIAITAANRIGWIMGFVNMALCIIGALHAAAKGSVADVVKSFAMAVLAWPLTAVCISVMITMDGIVGQVTHNILTVPLNGSADDVFGDSLVSNLVGTIVKTTGGFDLIIRAVVYLVFFLSVLALAGMLAARDISLILLACVAPLPVMMTGWKVTRPAAAKWAQAVVGVLLSAPLSALVIMVGSAICYVAKNNPNYTESFFPALMGIATIVMACFSPKLIMPAVSFIGQNVTADMQEGGGKVGPNAIKAAVQVTAGVVQAATTGNPSGIAKGLNTAAGSALSASQGNPSGIGSSIGRLFSDTGKDSAADAGNGDYGSSASPTPDGMDHAGPEPSVKAADDGMDRTGSTQAMDAAGHDGSDRAADRTPSAVPAAPRGRGGDAHADAGQGSRGGDGGSAAQSAPSSPGGRGGYGGDAGSSSGSRDTARPSGGSTVGPTVG